MISPPIHLRACNDYLSFIKLIFHLFRKDILTYVIVGSILSLAILLPSLISGVIFNHLHELSESSILPLVISFCLLLLVSALFSFLNEMKMKIINIQASRHIFPAVFNHIFDLPLRITRQYSSGELTQRFSDYEKAITVLTRSGLSLLLESFSLLVLLVYITYCNLLLAICCVMTGILILFWKSILFFKTLTFQSLQMSEQGRMTSLLTEILLQIHKIRSANAENKGFLLWMTRLIHLKELAEKSVRIEILSGMSQTLVPAILTLSLYAILYFSSAFSNPFLLLQFIICAGQFSSSIEKISSEMFSIFQSLPALKRLLPIMIENPEQDSPSERNVHLEGDIHFREVSYRDEESGSYLLRDISFHIQPGKFVAFVGASGAGKSTIFKLLLGWYPLSGGEILLNGKNIRHLNINQLRQQFGVVMQSSGLLPGTLFSNIAANALITQDEAFELAKCVGLDEEINRMPMKMNTTISDNPSESLSGGQKQKILIARALALKPRILLLDEATSAMDNKSQEHIFKTLRSLDITRVVIAHRHSTILHADRIYVLDKGKIIDEGTYGELAARGRFSVPLTHGDGKSANILSL